MGASKSLMDLASPAWKGRWGASPAGADFQAIVSALLEIKGEAASLAWLKAMKENAITYKGNGVAMKAVNAGEVDGVLNDVDLFLQGRVDVERRIGDQQGLGVQRHIKAEHMRHAPPRAQLGPGQQPVDALGRRLQPGLAGQAQRLLLLGGQLLVPAEELAFLARRLRSLVRGCASAIPEGVT